MIQAGDSRPMAAAPVPIGRTVVRIAPPDPARLDPADVARYIADLQQAQVVLGRAAPPDAARLAQIDAIIAHQVMRAGRRVPQDRATAVATLDAIFKLGHAPTAALDGETTGQLVCPALVAPLDAVLRGLTGLWMPWQGKRFFAAESAGDNILGSASWYLGHIYWPTYNNYHPLRRGLLTTFPFRTYAGPGVVDPDLTTLKLDYNSGANPGFLVRDVLDELVQVSDNYYLGKVFLRRPGGRYRFAAFFALQRAA